MNFIKKYLLSIIFIMIMSASYASAMEYKVLGLKSTSMGGASVAVRGDSMSVFNNPALLAKPTYDVEFSLGGGVGFTDNNASAAVSKLKDINFTDLLKNYNPSATPEQRSKLISGRDIIMGMNNASVNVAPEAFLGVQVRNIGVGVFGYGDINAQAKVDQAHNKLIVENQNSPGTYIDIETGNPSDYNTYQASSIDYAIKNGLTYLNVIGLAVVEVPVGYGHEFKTQIGSLSVGGSLKYMYGETFAKTINIDDDDIGKDLDKYKTTSSSFSIDIGLLYEPEFLPKARIGLVGKNLTSPKFDVAYGDSIKIDPQIRAGLAYDILESLEFAADMDLTSNKTLVDDLKSQMIGGGLNWHPVSWASLRGGLEKNIADSSALVFTAGISFGLKWFQFDIAGQYSSKSNTIQDKSIPEEAKVNIAIVSKW